MSESALALGLVMGLRHATDADHLAAIGSLLGGRGIRGALVTASLWGLGHNLTFWGLGLVLVVADVRVPDTFSRTADLLVAAMLVVLGVAQLRHLRLPPSQEPREDDHGHDSLAPHAHAASVPTSRWRPWLVGLVHGLAGSAGVALMSLLTQPTRLRALLYLGLFGVGVVTGMLVLTTVLAWPLSWSARHAGRVHRGLMLAASLGSVGLGVSLGVESL